MSGLDYSDCVDGLLAAADGLLDVNVTGSPDALGEGLRELARAVDALRAAERHLQDAAFDGQQCRHLTVAAPHRKVFLGSDRAVCAADGLPWPCKEAENG